MRQVVSFDLPRGYYAHQARVTTKSFDGAVAENFGAGLHVVHSETAAGEGNGVGAVGRLQPKPSEVDGTGTGNAVFYSVATRVVEQYPGPGARLQVQVRYGDTMEDMLENMPDPADTPEWSWTPSSQEIHQGGREIMLNVMHCSPANEHHAAAAGFHLESAPALHRPGALPQRAGPTVRTNNGHAEPIALASSRQRKLVSRQADSGDERVENEKGVAALRGGARALAAATSENGIEMDVAADEGSCDPYDLGDEWCEEAISAAEQRALEIQGTEIYCSRECDDHSALWCDIFGKKNCRMCSDDCDAYCEGKTTCRCHPCPVSGATETWACTLGKPLACYDQITESDYKSLVISEQRMQCAWSCLHQGGFWCQAFGIDGCRFCSLDCDDYCSSIGAVFGEDCDCIQCPDDLEDPPFEVSSETEERQSCADADDGDAFCLEQAGKETRAALETQGMGLECHEECYPGVAWPVWCFAEETVGCRYCKESCDEYCGEGVSECNSCYTCEDGSFSGSYSFQD
eukprot:g2159.t1